MSPGVGFFIPLIAEQAILRLDWVAIYRNADVLCQGMLCSVLRLKKHWGAVAIKDNGCQYTVKSGACVDANSVVFHDRFIEGRVPVNDNASMVLSLIHI